MDSIFGNSNFRNEIIWKRTAAHNDSAVYGNVHDIILYYSISNTFTHNEQYLPYSDEYIKKYYKHTDENGRRFLDRDLTAGSLSGGGYEYEWNGITKIWRCPYSTMQEYHESGKLYYTRYGTPRLKQFLDEMPGVPLQDVWVDIPPINSRARERVGYPTQKTVALLDRIIEASSNPGDVVFDPFCGCATTLMVADRLQRSWVGIDISPKAAELVVSRIRDDQGGLLQQITARDDYPQRTDMSDIPPARTHKHTLYGLQEGICGGCEIHFPFRNLTIDHKVPRSKGGTDHFENLWLLCGACNSLKGTGTVAEMRARLERG